MRALRHIGVWRRTAIALALLYGLLPALAPLGRAHAAGPRITAIQRTMPAASAYGEIELVVSLSAAYSNPFDPAQIDLHAVFTSPSGTPYTVNGFYYQNYKLYSNGHYAPLGAPQWRIRFSPPAPGSWRYAVYLRDSSGASVTSTLGSPFTVTPSKRHGNVRVSRHDPYYLAFDDGRSYFPVGENLSYWRTGSSVLDYDNWIEGRGKLRDQGVNFARIWLAPRSFSVDYGGALGNYSARMANAWALDYVLNLASRDGIYVLLTLQQANAFRGSDWTGSPYFVGNGGPLHQPCEFFTNPTAIAMFQRNLRYVVARYGYSISVLGWELFNEINLSANFVGNQPTYCGKSDELHWDGIMIDTLHALDPTHHLITTSFAASHSQGDPPTGEPETWRLPGIDVVQAHDYRYATPAVIAADVAALRQYRKPAWVGEFGLYDHLRDYQSPASGVRDVSGAYIHDGMWAGVMSGAAGSGFNWFWDNYVDTFHTYGVYRGLVRFLSGIQMDRQGFSPQPPRFEVLGPGVNAHVYTLQGRALTLAWVDEGAHYVGGHGAVTVPVRGSGTAHVEWWDTTSGTRLSTLTLRPAGGALSIPLPGSNADYALKIMQ